jgi:hypothetical protein
VGPNRLNSPQGGNGGADPLVRSSATGALLSKNQVTATSEKAGQGAGCGPGIGVRLSPDRGEASSDLATSVHALHRGTALAAPKRIMGFSPCAYPLRVRG